MSARRQAEVRSHLTRLGETAAVVDRTQERQGDDWANAWYCHQAAAGLIAPGYRDEQSVEFIDLCHDRLARLQKRIRGGCQRRPRCTAGAHANGESAAIPAGESDTKWLQQAANGVLEILTDADQFHTRLEQCPRRMG